jgi:septum formation topological specificity factor MinE
MSADKRKPDIPEEVIESLARTILPAIRAYFESEEGQREFAEWKEKKMKVQSVAKAVKPK